MTSPVASPSPSPGLTTVAPSDLVTLLRVLAAPSSDAPLSVTAIQAVGLGHLRGPLAPYLLLPRAALRAVVEVALAERQARPDPKLTLVWTGADPGAGLARHTRIFLPELLSRARKHVLIAGYSFDNGTELFAQLHTSMQEHGLTVDFFVDVQQLIVRLRHTARQQQRDWGLLAQLLKQASTEEAYGHATVDLFRELMWRHGPPYPRVYFDPRTAAKDSAVSLHAKCVVVDHHHALITSANFTGRGQKRNFETGIAVEDRTFSANLVQQWRSLVEAGVVVLGRA